MIRHTGGRAVGDTSTRSRLFSCASASASRTGRIPSWDPSSPITRTCGTRIRSLTRVSFARGSWGRNGAGRRHLLGIGHHRASRRAARLRETPRVETKRGGVDGRPRPVQRTNPPRALTGREVGRAMREKRRESFDPDARPWARWGWEATVGLPLGTMSAGNVAGPPGRRKGRAEGPVPGPSVAEPDEPPLLGEA